MFPEFTCYRKQNIEDTNTTFVEKLHNAYMLKQRTAVLEDLIITVIGVSRDKMKRRAFHLRSLIDHVKNKKVKKEVIKEYVSIISQISREEPRFGY